MAVTHFARLILLLNIVAMVMSGGSATSSTYTLAVGVACDESTEPGITMPTQSLMECVVACSHVNQYSSPCYDPQRQTCTCCSDIDDKVLQVGNHSGQDLIKCYSNDLPPPAACPTALVEAGESSLCIIGATVSFEVCKATCETYGLKVLRVENADQTLFVQLALLSVPSDYFWLGIIANTTDMARPWYFSDTGHEISYGNWNPGEPDGHSALPPEYCATAVKSSFFRWTDLACDWSIQCVCQT